MPPSPPARQSGAPQWAVPFALFFLLVPNLAFSISLPQRPIQEWEGTVAHVRFRDHQSVPGLHVSLEVHAKGKGRLRRRQKSREEPVQLKAVRLVQPQSSLCQWDLGKLSHWPASGRTRILFRFQSAMPLFRRSLECERFGNRVRTQGLKLYARTLGGEPVLVLLKLAPIQPKRLHPVTP